MTIADRWVLGVSALVLLAAAPALAQGIEDDVVRIGVTGPQTGPVAALAAVSEGIRTRVEAVNAAGGVEMADGRTRRIELVVTDDALDPQRSLANVRRMVESDDVFAVVGTAGTPNNQAIGRYITQAEVPNVFTYSGVHELSGPEWEIGFVPAFQIEARAFANYLEANEPDARVALLYLNTETGEIFSEAFEAAIEGTDIEIVARQPVTSLDPTVETQLTTLRASDADTLVVVTAPRQGAEAVRFQAESGWNPTLMVSNIAASIPVLTAAGLENAEGLVTASFLKSNLADMADDEGVAQYMADRETAGTRFSVEDPIGQTGYAIGDALVRALENTAEPTRESFMETVRNMDGWENPMLLDGITLRTGEGDVYPIEQLQLVRFDGTRYQSVGELEDFEGESGYGGH